MRLRSVGILAAYLAAIVATGPAWGTVFIQTVTVGNPNNAGDSVTGWGSVAYVYKIGKYEVTLNQYCEFLNAVAKTDTYNLWSATMMITRTGSDGSYEYAPNVDGNRPANAINWGRAARFANWLHNGQPTGAQGPSTTEDGAYYLNGATSQLDLLAKDRKVGAKWAIPSTDEWYKAAHYDPAKPCGSDYWMYTTRSDTINTSMANYNQGSNTATTIVGSYAFPSAYSTFDQGGNVNEWTEGKDGNNGIMDGGQCNWGTERIAKEGAIHYLSVSRSEGNPPFGFRVVNLEVDPVSISPNGDCFINGSVNMNNDAGGEQGLMIKGGTQVSYLEFTLGTAHATEAKLVLRQDDGGVKSEVVWTAMVRAAEFSFNEARFNTASAGANWPLVGSFEITGTPVVRNYELDVTDWYNGNLGKTMSIYLYAPVNVDPDCGPIFEDREGTRTGVLAYGPRIEVTPSGATCQSFVTPLDPQTAVGTDGREVWPRTFHLTFVNSGSSTTGYTVALSDENGDAPAEPYTWLEIVCGGNASVAPGGMDTIEVEVFGTDLGVGTHTAYIAFTDTCAPANKHVRQIDLVLNPVSKVLIDTTPILNTDNAADTRYEPSGIGAVAYEFRMGKYEVTASQYCGFLNAVAKTDTNGLYNPEMGEGITPCGIVRFGTSGNYTYRMEPGYEKRPVNFISFGDAIRFANWLHNGQPTGAQDATTTEDGAYTIGVLGSVTRNAGATWMIPSEDEWYKVAYYDPTLGSGGYWDYPTRSNTINTTMANYDNSVGGPLNVGSYGYPSFYGSLDQGGNIREWTEGIHSGTERYTRGGAFNFEVSSLSAETGRQPDSVTREYRNAGFRVATFDMGDPNRIDPNDDTTVRNTTNYNNTGNFGLFVKRNGDVSYLEFWLGNTPTVSAKLVLWQDNAELNVGYTVVARGDEFDFNESTFNNSSLGDTWPLLGTLAVSGVEPVRAFYELDITDWYNDNLGKRMSIFLRNDGTWNEYQSPMFEDREGTRTGDPETYGPRIVIDILQCNTPWADADGDGDVDMDDFALFQRCFSGSEMLSVDADEYCRCFDRNSDGKVNNTDLAAFEACSTGPGVLWVSSPECP